MTRNTTGIPMNPRHGPAFVFDPGALCLELLVTGGPGAYAVFESLHEPADLAAWCGPCRLRLDPERVTVTEGELDAARVLRDALWRAVLAHTDGRPLPREDVTVVNRAAARPPLAPRLTMVGEHSWSLPADATAVLSTIARDAVDLLTGPFAGRFRACGAHDCELVFVDTSRPGRRRWCSMDRCGNRAKVRALRARRETDDRR